ncbi:AraC family transcriptional regulator [Phocaeicola barnesiae]|jgi:AraC family transcriptional activator of pobA|uniref:helix-turn-helix domain-containing protein n=1 Tax=Phocaeicola barnesiae TaxID=376804 RepID=UPI0003781A69|nr:helix-turn-helix domain-containing protein [Phocaeicola barnesiae]MBS6467762.1 AraC family transcriptional regulator [Bacteroides sp.]MCF2575004.1 AraC family transcriptional regulator [Phocaeicola barnesiae]MDM8250152.1 helix-turn-helix domain-containing protein [Phocaeicola barnesiae]HJG77656.1 helix-turn-helix domain-containing protein [Phocaeicola barnesiae]
MDKELPKIDLPEDWLAGTDINKELLGLYTNFPVRLKCEVFVLCIEGTVEATLNLNKIQVYPHSLVTLPPGSIFQVNSIEGELKIYILGFSSQYIEENQHSHFLLDTMYHTLGKPVCSLNEKGVQIAESYFKLMIDLYENLPDKAKKEVAFNLYSDIHKGISLLYQSISNERANLSKSEMICRNFGQLVIQHYQNNRNVSWYAEKLGISHAHLCTIVKQITGHTCVEIIASMVIMDAKSQLKSTNLSIQEISDSLNFANMSFFGKYFKRNVGMSPLEYRNKG